MYLKQYLRIWAWLICAAVNSNPWCNNRAKKGPTGLATGQTISKKFTTGWMETIKRRLTKWLCGSNKLHREGGTSSRGTLLWLWHSTRNDCRCRWKLVHSAVRATAHSVTCTWCATAWSRLSRALQSTKVPLVTQVAKWALGPQLEQVTQRWWLSQWTNSLWSMQTLSSTCQVKI